MVESNVPVIIRSFCITKPQATIIRDVSQANGMNKSEFVRLVVEYINVHPDLVAAMSDEIEGDKWNRKDMRRNKDGIAEE